MFSLAYSYNFFPSIWIEEYIGGTWVISPKKEAKTSSIFSLLKLTTSLLSKTLPVKS